MGGFHVSATCRWGLSALTFALALVSPAAAEVSRLAQRLDYAQAGASASQPGVGLQPSQVDGGAINLRLKPSPSLPGWTKICQQEVAGTEYCFTTLDFVSEDDKPTLAVALYEARNGSQRVARFMLPTSLLLQQGMRFAIDGGQWVAGRYRICSQTGCVAETPIKDEVNFAKGTNLTVSVLNGDGREVAFTVPLAGFAKAHEGPPISAEALRSQQEAFVKDAERRGREMMGRALEESSNPPGASKR